jgi:hypothetical protein
MNYHSLPISLAQNATFCEVIFPSTQEGVELNDLSVYLTDLQGKIIKNFSLNVSGITTTGFNVNISPAIPSAGYFLRYVISENIPSCCPSEDEVTEEVLPEYDLGVLTYGDSWTGIPIITIKVNNLPPEYPVESATIIFTKGSVTGTQGLILTEEDGITIQDNNEWEFLVPPIVEFPLTVGTWFYRFKTVDSQGMRKTWLTGKIKIVN